MLAAHAKVLAFIIVAVLALHAYQAFIVKTVADDATLMEPAVRRRAIKVFTTADGGPPPRGAIVWFEHPLAPNRMLLSRAIGLPGDRIAVEHGRIVRDGAPLSEDYADKRIDLEDLDEIAIPDGYVYVANDARGDSGSPSVDSRHLGPIPATAIVGWTKDKVADREAQEAPRERAKKPAGRR